MMPSYIAASYLNGRLALQLPSTLRISIHSMKSPEQPLGEFRLPLDPAFTDGVSGQLYQWLPFCRPSRYIKYPHSRLVRSSRLLSDQDLLVPPSEQDRDEDLKYELLSNRSDEIALSDASSEVKETSRSSFDYSFHSLILL